MKQRHSYWILGLFITLTSSLFAIDPFLAAQGAKPAISSASHTVSKVVATVSNVTSSTTPVRDPILGMIRGPLAEPKLVEGALAKHVPELEFENGMSQETRGWLKDSLMTYLEHYPLTMRGELSVVVKDHRGMRRKNIAARVMGSRLLISTALAKSRNEAELFKSLALATWELVPQTGRRTWAMLAGWSRHPFLPLFETNKGLLGKSAKGRVSGCREDFARSVCAFISGAKISQSRQAYLSQLSGLPPRAGASLDEVKVHLAYVDGKGFLGASQGHCALVIERNGEKRSFAYVADFDFSKPIQQGLRACVGDMPRLLEVMKFEDFKSEYVKSGRGVHLVDLKLGREQKERLLFRLDEFFGFENGQYSFFRQNCANPLRDLLDYTLLHEDGGLRRWHTPKSLYHWSLKRDASV